MSASRLNGTEIVIDLNSYMRADNGTYSLKELILIVIVSALKRTRVHESKTRNHEWNRSRSRALTRRISNGYSASWSIEKWH